jgi:PKD repeat protein
MNLPGRLIVIAFSFLNLVFHAPLPASAQYMFLDVNGDGIHDDSDALDPSGVTRIDIWLDTARNRDGSPAFCDTDAATPLTVNSWEVSLQAVGGTVEWGPLDNMLAISAVNACFADAADTTDPVWYHNGWGGNHIIDPGRYHVGRLRVRVLTGNPAVVFRPYNPAQPNDLTSFGTRCLGLQGDNTYRLGEDWWDAAGLGNELVADAGGPYWGRVNEPLTFDSRHTLNAQGLPLTYEWDFGDGSRGTGAAPSHTYTRFGEYRVELRVSDGTRTHETWTTATVLEELPPNANAGGPYRGYTDVPILFDGRGSSDPNGDPLVYLWRFGDGTSGADPYVLKTYFQAGTYTVSLTVIDGNLSTTDLTSARIEPGPSHAPVPDAGGPYHGFAGARIQLDGTGTTDPDGDPLQYRWILGDGNEEVTRSPHHTYAEAGTYEVILEVTDGTFTTSDVTTATIGRAMGAPPLASAGGPYTGMARRPIAFQGGGSSDPDGDALTYRWDFGDRTIGTGSSPSHVYYAPAQYGVVLTVSDGVHVVEARTSVLVSQSASALGRVFPAGGVRDVAMASLPSTFTLHVEPIGGSFLLDEIDAARIVLRCTGSSVPHGIEASGSDPTATDSDGNGEAEIAAVFRAEDMARLLAHVTRPSTVHFTLTAPIRTGGEVMVEWTARVIPAGAFEAIVRPNPFNPQAVVTFVTSRSGSVNARLYDTAGRLVRTVLRDQPMDAGAHDLPILARSDSGAGLSSGVYFLRLEGPDGVVVKRVAVAK